MDDLSDTLSVSGLTVSGTVSVYLPEGAVSGKFLTTSGMPTLNNNATFNVYVGGVPNSSLGVIPTSSGLTVSPKAKGTMFLFN